MQKESSQKYGSCHEEDEWRKDGGGAADEFPGDDGIGDVAVVHEVEEEANLRKKGQGKISEVW